NRGRAPTWLGDARTWVAALAVRDLRSAPVMRLRGHHCRKTTQVFRIVSHHDGSDIARTMAGRGGWTWIRWRPAAGTSERGTSRPTLRRSWPTRGGKTASVTATEIRG